MHGKHVACVPVFWRGLWLGCWDTLSDWYRNSRYHDLNFEVHVAGGVSSVSISVYPHAVQIGSLISAAMDRVGRQGVVTMEESRTAEDNLYVVEGMQFERGYISPYFVTDPERMVILLAFERLYFIKTKLHVEPQS